jgi:hypothetical protein
MRVLKFEDVPTVEEMRKFTLQCLEKGVADADVMRDMLARDLQVLVEKTSTDWKSTPSGTFVNRHAWALANLVRAGVIERIGDKQYQRKHRVIIRKKRKSG